MINPTDMTAFIYQALQQGIRYECVVNVTSPWNGTWAILKHPKLLLSPVSEMTYRPWKPKAMIQFLFKHCGAKQNHAEMINKWDNHKITCYLRTQNHSFTASQICQILLDVMFVVLAYIISDDDVIKIDNWWVNSHLQLFGKLSQASLRHPHVPQ